MSHFAISRQNVCKKYPSYCIHHRVYKITEKSYTVRSMFYKISIRLLKMYLFFQDSLKKYTVRFCL